MFPIEILRIQECNEEDILIQDATTEIIFGNFIV